MFLGGRTSDLIVSKKPYISILICYDYSPIWHKVRPSEAKCPCIRPGTCLAHWTLMVNTHDMSPASIYLPLTNEDRNTALCFLSWLTFPFLTSLRAVAPCGSSLLPQSLLYASMLVRCPVAPCLTCVLLLFEDINSPVVLSSELCFQQNTSSSSGSRATLVNEF